MRGPAKLYAILPDQQAPLHDARLHELVLRWLDTNRPDGKIYSGDLIDLTSISRHGWNPRIVRNPYEDTQHSIDVTNKLLWDYHEASGKQGDDWLIPGNHEERMQKFIISNAPQIYGLRRASRGEDVEPALSLQSLLGLKELGIQWAGGDAGDWPHARVRLSKHLEVRHGWLARKHAGATAHATLEHLNRSVIVGHTHRMATVFKTRHDPDGSAKVLVGVEAGTLARFDLGYAVDPDWQQGFTVVRVHDDGTFHISHATYVGGVLWWEGQRFKNTAGKGVVVAL